MRKMAISVACISLWALIPAIACASPPRDPACDKPAASWSRKPLSGKPLLIGIWPAGAEISPLYLPLYDNNKDKVLDARDARYLDSVGFHLRGAVQSPEAAGIKRVYLWRGEPATLDRQRRKPIKLYARTCFGLAMPDPKSAPSH